MSHVDYEEEEREHWKHNDNEVQEANDDNKGYDTWTNYNTDIDHDDDRGIDLWYEKVKIFLDHVNEFSQTHCVHPGFALSTNEMMKLSKGRSTMMCWMKKKPIKEGFKFFCHV